MRSLLYVVYPGAWWGWDVVRDGSDNDVNFETQEAALEYAFDAARMLGSARVALEDARGQVQALWDVPDDAKDGCRDWDAPAVRHAGASGTLPRRSRNGKAARAASSATRVPGGA